MGSIPVTRSRLIAAKNTLLGRFFVWERACLLFIEHAPWSSVLRPLRKYRIHGVDGKNGVNLLFLVSLILFRDMREEIDSRIFDPPSYLRQEK